MDIVIEQVPEDPTPAQPQLQRADLALDVVLKHELAIRPLAALDALRVAEGGQVRRPSMMCQSAARCLQPQVSRSATLVSALLCPAPLGGRSQDR